MLYFIYPIFKSLRDLRFAEYCLLFVVVKLIEEVSFVVIMLLLERSNELGSALGVLELLKENFDGCDLLLVLIVPIDMLHVTNDVPILLLLVLESSKFVVVLV